MPLYLLINKEMKTQRGGIPRHGPVSLNIQDSTPKPKLLSVRNGASYTVLQTLTSRGMCLGSLYSVWIFTKCQPNTLKTIPGKTARGKRVSHATRLGFWEYEAFSTQLCSPREIYSPTELHYSSSYIKKKRALSLQTNGKFLTHFLLSLEMKMLSVFREKSCWIICLLGSFESNNQYCDGKRKLALIYF